MPQKPQSIDAYLAAFSAQQRAMLEQLRKTIHAAAPEAEECISYGLPAFRLAGRALVAFGGWKSHCALYPMSAATVRAFGETLEKYATSKGTIQFDVEKPLPLGLVRKLVKARIAENAAKLRAKSKPKAKAKTKPKLKAKA